ncbi:MAG: class II aldolase/adducin family protein [Bacteroidota bacterium]|nr:class II aldolase/adducin family protein [Bacteroidota bacterium]
MPQKIATELITICHRVEHKGFVTATDGNISARLQNGNILTTPTSLNKRFVQIEDLVEVTLAGQHVRGTRKASSELQMHLFVYRNREDVNAVVHCHPTYATGFAAARIPLTSNVFPEVVIGLGDIPLAEYATPSTAEVSESLKPFVQNSSAILLSNHGVVTYGKSLWDAYFKMEKVEHLAQMLFVAKMLGGEKTITDDQVQNLKKAFLAVK